MKLYGKAQSVGEKILFAFQHPETLPEVIAPIFIHRKDDLPCRKWSFRNQFLTALAGTDDARGFKQWQAIGRNVKKGSKAFGILSPCVKKIKDTNTGEDTTKCYGFRVTSVFRLEDTEGEAVETGDPELDQWIEDLPLRDVASAWGISVRTYNGIAGNTLVARYQQTKDGGRKAIALGVQDINVFLHELMHAADYQLGNVVEQGQHWRKETVAEFGSAILAECLGLEGGSNLGGAYKYIESYAKAAEKTPQAACLECLDRICQAVALVLDTAETLAVETVAA